MQTKTRLLKNGLVKKSVTLVEILVAVGILATVVISLLIVFLNCMLLNSTNRERMRATTHAQYVLEEINAANTDVSVIAALIASNTTAGWDWNTTDITAESLNALKNESIDTGATWWDIANDLLNVTVTVNWDDLRGRPSNVTISSLFAG